MKRTRNITRHAFALIPALFMAIFVLKAVAIAQVNSSWVFTGSLNIPVSGHTATLLSDGRFWSQEDLPRSLAFTTLRSYTILLKGRGTSPAASTHFALIIQRPCSPMAKSW